MTSKNQIRSVLMTLLLVTSVFAGVAAFSGSAAAEVTGVSLGADKAPVGGDVTVTVSNETGDSTVSVVAVDEDGNVIDSSEGVSTSASGSTEVTLSLAGASPGSYTVYANNSSTAPSSGFASWSDADAAGEVVKNASGVYFQGQTVYYNAPSGASGEVQLVRNPGQDDQQFVSQLSENGNGFITVDTSGREAGSYGIQIGNSVETTFQIAVQDLSASFEDGNITNADGASTTLTLDSNRNSYNVSVSANNLDTSELEDVFGDAGAATDDETYELDINNQNSEITVDTSALSANEYDFEFEVVDTDASASAQLNVSNPGDTTADFQPNVVSQEVGDVAAVTVNMENADQATVNIGDSSVSYTYTATVEDGNGDGEVTILFNTYDAGRVSDANDIATVANDDDSIVSASQSRVLGAPVAPGDYPMNITIDQQEKNVGTLVLNQRSTDGIQVWTAPGSASPENAEELYGAVSNTSEIAQGDWAVIQVQASGIYGYLDAEDLNGTNGEGLSLELTQTNAAPNSPGSSFYANDSIIQDPENNTFFALVDTSELTAGAQYEATFSINGSNAYISSDDATESVSTELSIADTEADFTFDGDQLVLGGSNATLSGETNLAPGTEVTLRVQSNDNSNPFLKTATATVGQDGTFNASFDMSGIPQGTEFTASIGRPSSISDVSETGVVGESSEQTTEQTTEMTTTEQTTEQTTTEMTTTSEEETTTTPAPETTTTTEGEGGQGGDGGADNGNGQPGFGITAALIALVAAALIAIRRD